MEVDIIFRYDSGGFPGDMVIKYAQIAVELSRPVTEKFKFFVCVLLATVGRHIVFLMGHKLSSLYSLLYMFFLAIKLLFGDLLIILASRTSYDFVFYILFLFIHCRLSWLSTLMANCMATK